MANYEGQLFPLSFHPSDISVGIDIPTTIKTVANAGDYFIGIDNTGALYKITKADLLAGSSSGGSGGTSYQWLSINNNYSANINDKIVAYGNTNFTITLPSAIGEVEIYNNSSATVSIALNTYNGVSYGSTLFSLKSGLTRLLWINSSIGWYPLINTLTGLMLDGLNNVVSARSIRKLNSAYTGKAQQAILANNTTQDINFSGNTIDTAALLTFANSGNAFVSKTYDQVGAFDATQTVISSCPKIVDNGSTITAGSKPTLAFNNNFLTSAIPCGYPITIIAVVKILASTNGAFIKYGNNNNGVGIGVGNGTFDSSGVNLIGLNEVIAWVPSNNPISTSQMSIVEINSTGSVTNIYLNGVLAATGGGSNAASGTYNIGGYSNRYPICQISEDIVFNTIIDATTRASIVANMKQYYNIL